MLIPETGPKRARVSRGGELTRLLRFEGPTRWLPTKAGGEMMVRAYHHTYGVPTIVTRGSNTYGPYQYPEKTERPLGSFKERTLHELLPSLASRPVTVTSSPSFSASLVQPWRVSEFGGPASHCQ